MSERSGLLLFTPQGGVPICPPFGFLVPLRSKRNAPRACNCVEVLVATAAHEQEYNVLRRQVRRHLLEVRDSVEGSSAGMIPSLLVTKSNPSRASASVIETYCARSASFR